MYTKHAMSNRFIRENLARALKLTAILAIALATLWFALEANNGSAQAAPTDWRDDFITETLDSAWSWIINENDTMWSPTERSGFMRIYTSPYGTGVENLLLRSVDTGDFAIQTHLFFEPNADFQIAGLVIYQDESNFLQFGRAYCDIAETCVGNGIYFDNILEGSIVDGNFATLVDNPSEAYLRLEYKGSKVYAYYSEDETNWRLIGVHTLPDGFTANAVGLTSSQNFHFFDEVDPVPAVPADFDYFALEPPTAALTYVVNTTDDADDGTCDETHCSLREAINAANAHPGADTIAFNIPEPPFTIQPGSALPDIADPVTIDGTTQDGYAGNPIVELDGSVAGEVVGGLVIWAGDSTVKGLVINRFYPGDGIVLTTNGGNTIQGSFIGTDLTGTLALGNFRGVLVTGGSSGNLIDDNLISGNAGAGIRLDMGAEGNKVQGNFIGTDLAGMSRLGNGAYGVRVMEGATNNLIGGPEESARNLISGGGDAGVLIEGEGTTGNTVQGNYIGTDVTGSSTPAPAVGEYTLTALPETCPTYDQGTGFDGFFSGSNDPLAPWSATPVQFKGTDKCGSPEMHGAASLIYRYRLEFAEDTQLTSIVVSGAAFNGPDSLLRVLDENRNVLGSTDTFGGNSFQIHVIPLQSTVGKVFFVEEFDTSTTWRYRDKILLNVSPMGNLASGVTIADLAFENLVIGNLISGNVYGGVEIYDPGTSGNTLQGNSISGNSPGIFIADSEKTRIVGNVVTDNRYDGIWMGGSVSITNGNVIGGTTAEERNVISGNGAAGISINEAASENLILGNFIGTDETGTLPWGNSWVGVLLGSGSNNNIIGGTEPGAGNLISGNGGDGVLISDPGSTDNVVQGNLIGTDWTGTVALGNVQGVAVGGGASGNLIGGTGADDGNLISGNGGDGVLIADPGTTGNVIQGNLIGTDSSGTAALPNGGVGVWVGVGATDTLIGGADEGAGNLISGNSVDGVSINHPETTGTRVLGNYIGTNQSGDAALPNGASGVFISASQTWIGGIESGAWNLISGNTRNGINITETASGNFVQGNLIGTDLTGMSPLGNGDQGIQVLDGAADNLIGGIEDGARNVISGNGFAGVFINGDGTTGNTVQGNYIGTDRDGSEALANSGIGVLIVGDATGNLVGGTEAGARNVISGNPYNVILSVGVETAGNTLQGNYIGIDSSGSKVLPNSEIGVLIFEGAANNLIGGTEGGAGNVISGNKVAGVYIAGEGATGNTVQGNFIGTDATGTKPLGNQGKGVRVEGGAADNTIGGTDPGAGNLISGNIEEGVWIVDPGTTGNTVQGNFIGTDVTGSTVTTPAGPELGVYTVTAMPETCPTYPADTDKEGWVSESNQPLAPWSGISVLFKGTDECPNEMLGEASLIYRYKLEFEEPTQLTSIVVTGGNFNGPDNVLQVLDAEGNVLGTTATFENPYLLLEGVLGSVFYIEEYDTSSEYRFRQSIIVNGPVPLGNHGNGVYLAAGASDNLIGGTDPGARNLISGNVSDGVAILDPDTMGNKVQGNFIGTDVTGTVALGNLSRGIIVEGGPTGNLIGGTGPHAGNLISGNEAAGIGLFGVETEGNQVQGNFIGTDITGMSPMGNGISDGLPGVRIGEGAADNLVGGTEPGAGNTIAFNGGPGIALSDDAGSGNSILSNSVFSNEGLGIDLGFDGVTRNDPLDKDAGPNDLQNYPLITVVTRAGASVMIRGLLSSTPSTTFRLEFFSNETCDPFGFGEGETFLGFGYVTTNPGGMATFNITLPVSVPQGAFVTATATDPGGSTSEFSGCATPSRRIGGYFPQGPAGDTGLYGYEMSDVALPVSDRRLVR